MFFSGSYVAIVTPWTDDGSKIDYKAFSELVEWQIASGTDGIVPAGTTGESATLTHTEQHELIEKAVQFVNGRCKVLAGAGSNSTTESVQLAKHAQKVGADGILVITPYYNRPTPEGLYRHFLTVAENCSLPMMMYNVPVRTGTNMLPETVARIRRTCPSIVSIKEASGNVDQGSRIRQLCDIGIMSGDDSLTLPLMSVGGDGVVSVAANVDPRTVKLMVAAAAAGDFAKAREYHYKLMPLFKNLFVETNPIPAKTALRIMGRCNGVLRLPLVAPSADSEKTIHTTLRESGLV